MRGITIKPTVNQKNSILSRSCQSAGSRIWACPILVGLDPAPPSKIDLACLPLRGRIGRKRRRVI